ncbi:hypothetical protein V5O48_006485 [Marasmius crinis-equi]|uniref:Uncharacterized protein n=1 Tax=Marasmius crinis-equi TaxID=585013 RepID=A0ABR3FJR3_9AGAR
MLEAAAHRLKDDVGSLGQVLRKRRAEEKELRAELETLLEWEERTIATEKRKEDEAVSKFQAASARITYLERAVKAANFEEILADLDMAPSRIGIFKMLPFLNESERDEDAMALEVENNEEDGTNECDVSDVKDAEVAVRPPTVTTVAFPDEPVPEWFRVAFHCLNVSIGDQYLVLVGHWVTIERLKGWEASKRGLTARFRPQELSQFVRQGKYRWEYGPATGKDFVGGFSNRVREWWSFLLESSRGEWQSLNHSGQNGWCLLLISMKWWATGLADMEDARERRQARRIWEITLEGMSEAAQGLITFLEGVE